MNIQRYSLVDESDEATSYMEMDLDGDYVDYADAKQAIDKLRSALISVMSCANSDGTEFVKSAWESACEVGAEALKETR